MGRGVPLALGIAMANDRPHAGSLGSAETRQTDDIGEHAVKRNRPRAADPDVQRHPGDYMAGAEGTQHVAQPEPAEDKDEK